MADNCYNACLIDCSILPWEQSSLESTNERHSGRTTIIDYLGMDSLNVRVGSYKDDSLAYRIHASASKYLAEIIRNHLGPIADSELLKPQREVLFVGAIAVYVSGELPFIKVAGYDLAAQGRIWSASADVENAKKPNGLRQLVLGKFKTVEEAVARVESIIGWYAVQERMSG